MWVQSNGERFKTLAKNVELLKMASCPNCRKQLQTIVRDRERISFGTYSPAFLLARYCGLGSDYMACATIGRDTVGHKFIGEFFPQILLLRPVIKLRNAIMNKDFIFPHRY